MMGCGKSGKKGSRYVYRFLALGLALGGAVSMAGCSMPTIGEKESEDVLVLIENPEGEEKSIYTLTEVVVTDVEKTASIRFNYSQARSEDVYFPLNGKRVAEVYVKKGDRVEEGQLLAVLEGGDHEDAIRDLEYQIARNKLRYSYLEENEACEKSAKWWWYAYQSSGSDAEEERLQNDLANIEQNYRYKREDYLDKIQMAEMRLEVYQKEMEEGRIYAGMSGVISKLGGDMSTIVSDVNKSAFTILDDSYCLFESMETEYAEYFKEGETYELTGGRGTSAVVYQARAWNKNIWGDRIYLEVFDEEEIANIEIGTYAYLTLVLDKRENVLAVNSKVLHTADGKSYVYVLGENDIREIRWVETGLCGDKLTEIVSGLEEGEAVILK